jgi:hypothetical protein
MKLSPADRVAQAEFALTRAWGHLQQASVDMWGEPRPRPAWLTERLERGLALRQRQLDEALAALAATEEDAP